MSLTATELAAAFGRLQRYVQGKYLLEGAEAKTTQALADLRAIAEAWPHRTYDMGSTSPYLPYDCACLYSPDECNCERAAILAALEGKRDGD